MVEAKLFRKPKDAILFLKNSAIVSIILGIISLTVGVYFYGRLQVYPQLEDIPFWIFILAFVILIAFSLEGIITWVAVKTIEKSIKKE